METVMLPALLSEPCDPLVSEPVFSEEKLGDGSVRYHMNETLRKHAEAAVAKLSSEKITNFERRVIEAVRSGR